MQAQPVLAGIFNLPAHPILVHFTSALIPLSFLNDLLARVLKRHSLAVTGWWMLFYGAIITPTTAAAGWWWSKQFEGADQWEMKYHMWMGFSLTGVLIAWTFWRWRFYRHNHLPGWGYLAATLLLVGAVIAQGHLGGMMSFGD